MHFCDAAAPRRSWAAPRAHLLLLFSAAPLSPHCSVLVAFFLAVEQGSIHAACSGVQALIWDTACVSAARASFSLNPHPPYAHRFPALAFCTGARDPWEPHAFFELMRARVCHVFGKGTRRWSAHNLARRPLPLLPARPLLLTGVCPRGHCASEI